MKAARSEEAAETDASLALWRINFQRINAAFLAGRSVARSEIARQQKPSRRFAIVAKHEIERKICERRFANRISRNLISAAGRKVSASRKFGFLMPAGLASCP